MALDWSQLRTQCWQKVVDRFLPRGKRDWFFLRERWNLYSDDMRSIVLAVARIETLQPIELYSNTEKRAIATAIALINAFSESDKALIAKEKHKWEKLYQPEE
ncbi:hypothetical protein A1D25_05025 [Ursidibacter arcticus]|uniref:hypothetical protein n=1 Tax=Ursidibacter arcticus TaxID=1524965 RepID=UPI0012FA7CB9|nr:hypothetical protein [Ursidibacter arcticus]KAE9535310.1 hypothetical protein A1D25_05025 [Ursidibacter arcticus]